jgi:hypothetical protein
MQDPLLKRSIEKCFHGNKVYGVEFFSEKTAPGFEGKREKYCSLWANERNRNGGYVFR